MIRFIFTLFAVVACTVGTGCVAGVEDDPEMLEAEQAVWIDEGIDDEIAPIETDAAFWQTTPVINEQVGNHANSLAAMDAEGDGRGTDEEGSNPEPTPWHDGESNPEPTPWHDADDEGSNPEPTPWHHPDPDGDDDERREDDEDQLDANNGFMADTTTSEQNWTNWL